MVKRRLHHRQGSGPYLLNADVWLVRRSYEDEIRSVGVEKAGAQPVTSLHVHATPSLLLPPGRP